MGIGAKESRLIDSAEQPVSHLTVPHLGRGPFVPGFGRKPDGANYYPSDMTRAEFETLLREAV